MGLQVADAASACNSQKRISSMTGYHNWEHCMSSYKMANTHVAVKLKLWTLCSTMLFNLKGVNRTCAIRKDQENKQGHNRCGLPYICDWFLLLNAWNTVQARGEIQYDQLNENPILKPAAWACPANTLSCAMTASTNADHDEHHSQNAIQEAKPLPRQH